MLELLQARFSPVLIEISTTGENLFMSLNSPDIDKGKWSRIHQQAKRVCLDSYGANYPEYDVRLEEPHDYESWVFYSRNGEQKINSVIRVCFDSSIGLPIEASLYNESSDIAEMRKKGLVLAEPGRFAIENGGGVYRRFMSAIYQLANFKSVDIYLLQVRSNHADFYRRFCLAHELSDVPAPPGCVNLCWHINQTPRAFFRAFGSNYDQLQRFLQQSV